MDDPLTAGTPSYVIQEEFTRLISLFVGYPHTNCAKILKYSFLSQIHWLLVAAQVQRRYLPDRIRRSGRERRENLLLPVLVEY